VFALTAEAEIMGQLALTDGKEVAAKRSIEAGSRSKFVLIAMSVMNHAPMVDND
jgi:hypothetical protein